jgi:beta-lactamase regulating signal transducer with metallopeptidase domain
MLPEAELSLPVRDILVHELAHLRRNDCFWNLVRHTATAILFFQPLIWRLSRRLAATAEEVCDDYVVQFGGDRSAYANRLIDIATLSAAPLTATGIVSLRSMLAMRVARILDTSRSLSTRVGNLLLALLLVVGLSATLLVGLLGVEPNRVVADANPGESFIHADAEERTDGDATSDNSTQHVNGQS